MPRKARNEEFVSSVMNGFEDFRAAAFAAIRSLDHDVIRLEDFAASYMPSRVLCRPCLAGGLLSAKRRLLG